MNYEIYGRIAYEAYRARVDKTLPNFDHITEAARQDWAAVAQVVCEAVL